MQRKILVVDDDAHIREVICFALEQIGMKVWEAADGNEALDLFKKVNPDLIVLDVMMPEMDGLEVCKQLRKESDVAILFLSARNEEIDRIIGLEIGGDDYVPKPFSPRELVARVKVILRRLDKHYSNEKNGDDLEIKVLTHGNLRLDIESHTAYWLDTVIPLTATEFSLLKVLLRHSNKVFERDSLMNGAYSQNVAVNDRTIDSHIRRIRQKYADAGCDNVIITVHSVGYKIGTCQ